ncbi:MAG TPA: hypothetical protein VJ996_03980, partial [Solirubrobacteraceae bacterium]|nr:hypothetical protein [Solirubrobacteraceae bacterium]
MSHSVRTDEERERERAEREQRRTPTAIHKRRWTVVALALPALAIVALGAWLAIDRLTSVKHSAAKPIAAPAIVRVLIPEGETRLQIAARAHAAGLRGSYLTASKRSALLDPAHYGAPA